MCARSHTSGLMSAECAVSTSASESGATRSSVRWRASSSAPVMSVATGTGDRVPDPTAVLRALGLPPHVDDLADRRGAIGDPRVQRPDRELEAPRARLLELRDERVEAAALLVDEDDVAGPDPL